MFNFYVHIYTMYGHSAKENKFQRYSIPELESITFSLISLFWKKLKKAYEIALLSTCPPTTFDFWKP
jgi:hypothetical protein